MQCGRRRQTKGPGLFWREDSWARELHVICSGGPLMVKEDGSESGQVPGE